MMHFRKSSTQFLLLTVTAQLGWADFYTLSGRINHLTGEYKLNLVFENHNQKFHFYNIASEASFLIIE